MSGAQTNGELSPAVSFCHPISQVVTGRHDESAELANIADIGDLSDIAAFDLSKLSNAGDEAALAAFLAAMPPDEARAIEQGTFGVGSPAMAAIRLRGALDAVMRDALTVAHLVALADRLTIDRATVADLALLDAFDAADLTTANMSAAGLIVEQAGPFRSVAAVMLRRTRRDRGR